VHVTVTALTWRDLHRRTPGQVRGKKAFWRVFSALNTGNSALYWLFARRRLSGSMASIDRPD
jgi:hypothetical protein